MSSLPIACSLTVADLAAAQQRYRDAASHYQASAEISANQATITLTGDQPTIHDILTDMIARETTCCPFLTFDVIETSTGYVVHLRLLNESDLGTGILEDAVTTLFPTAVGE